ncbi:hypothetical protein [Streptacidiphilus sp. PAMC 29251]
MSDVTPITRDETTAPEEAGLAGAVNVLLSGLPRVKITPATIDQHLIDQWYERERKYGEEIAALKEQLAAAPAQALDKAADLAFEVGQAYRAGRYGEELSGRDTRDACEKVGWKLRALADPADEHAAREARDGWEG